MSRRSPIGVFDSGIGGLTVVREIRRALPGEDIVYFGDTARVPYGNKSKQTVTRFSVENCEFLLRRGVKLVVVACNTSSSLSLNFLNRCFRVPVIGVIAPGAKQAALTTRNKKIGVIGTKATIDSNAYLREVKRADPAIRCFSKACPLFVPLVEEGWLDNGISEKVAGAYLKELSLKSVDTLILGCTHYPLLKNTIQRMMGRTVRIVDSAEAVAAEVKDTLTKRDILNDTRRKARYRFYVSDDPKGFTKLGGRFLKMKIKCAMRSSA
ncbi:glutamate racemase [Candidatus Omnitrophota bacterium]